MERVEESRAGEPRPSLPSLAGAGHDLLQTVSALNIAWAQKNVEQVKESLREFISTVDDPMTALLDLLDHYNPTKGRGNSLAVLIACEFQKWIKDHPEYQQSGLRLKKLQARVFPLVAEGTLLEILLSVYKLEEAERSFVLGNVTHLHQMGKYKEAAILSIHLNLQPDLDLEQMCTPLLLLDRFNLLEAYVSGYPELQSQLLQMLDRWSDSSFNPRKLSKQYQGLPPIKPDKLNLKTLSKLAFRLLETYNLDPALCSNMINQRHLGTLKYLMYKRFVDKTMTQENWADHVQNTADGNRWLQEQCIALLCRYTDLQTAGFWALKFGMPKETLPKNVADILQDLCIQEKLSESEKNPEDSQARRNHFYQLPIPRSKVHFLQNHTELSGCRDAVLKDGQVVGVDMEWRPSFGGLGKPNVSLIQLAVKEEVFLLDVLQGSLLQSSDSAESPGLVTFIKDLFSSTKITKLGYGMVGDFQSLDATDAGFRGLELRNVVDLSEAHKQMQRSRSRPRAASGPVDVLENTSGDDCIRQPEKGLSLLVKDVLGKPLDKKEQLSNWDKRPLRENQIIYAAADAYCLLDVFETLCCTPEKFGLKPNFYELPKGKTSPKKDVRRSPRQKESVLKNNRLKTPPPKATPTKSSSPQTKPVSSREFSVICDNMLQGLGRYLRSLGVDVLMLENDDDHRKAAEIARLDGRVILTCGMPYQTLRSQVGEERCFYVNCSERAKEQAIRVLKHFNVRVTHGDVFSRCQVCNCNKYLHISQDRMMQLMKLRSYLEEVRETQGPPPASPPERLFPSESLQWMEEMGISSESLLLANGTQLQLDAVPAGLLDKVPLFFCCSQCGKIFWEGSHFGRVVSQFKEVLQDNGECIYQSASHQGP